MAALAEENPHSNHLRTFYTLVATQTFSLIGSQMTTIAVGIWVFEKTGYATPLLMVAVVAALPTMLAGIFAGTLTDRWDRRWVLIGADTGQALATFLLMLSFALDSFQLWHLYAVTLIQAIFVMFQRPAIEASITMLVPDAQRDRANAINQMVAPIATVLAPLLTGFLYLILNVSGIILIDLITYGLAVAVLSTIHIPQPESAADSEETGAASFWQETKAGFLFLWQRQTLFWFIIYGMLLNFLVAGPLELSVPYIYTLTDAKLTLGILLGIMNLGPILGGILVGSWSGGYSRIKVIVLAILCHALFLVLYGMARSPLLLGISLLFLLIPLPIVNALSMSFLQAKVPPEMQGRVFSFAFQLNTFAIPIALVVAGPLVDRVLEPSVSSSRWQAIAPIMGNEAGAGMGLLMVIAGVLLFIISLAVYFHPKVQTLEQDLPDYAPEAVEAG